MAEDRYSFTSQATEETWGPRIAMDAARLEQERVRGARVQQLILPLAIALGVFTLTLWFLVRTPAESSRRQGAPLRTGPLALLSGGARLPRGERDPRSSCFGASLGR